MPNLVRIGSFRRTMWVMVYDDGSKLLSYHAHLWFKEAGQPLDKAIFLDPYWRTHTTHHTSNWGFLGQITHQITPPASHFMEAEWSELDMAWCGIIPIGPYHSRNFKFRGLRWRPCTQEEKDFLLAKRLEQLKKRAADMSVVLIAVRRIEWKVIQGVRRLVVYCCRPVKQDGSPVETESYGLDHRWNVSDPGTRCIAMIGLAPGTTAFHSGQCVFQIRGKLYARVHRVAKGKSYSSWSHGLMVFKPFKGEFFPCKLNLD